MRLGRLGRRPLAAAWRRRRPAGTEKRHQISDLAFRKNLLKGRHALPAIEDLFSDLVGIATLTDFAQIGRPVSADTGDAMATLAPMGMKQKRAVIAFIGLGCMGDGMIKGNKCSDQAAETEDTRANRAAKWNGHLQPILSNVSADLSSCRLQVMFSCQI